MAALQPFRAGGDWNRTAAAQQIMIVNALYRDARSVVEAYLGNDATILRWVHAPTTWPPDYAVIRNNDGEVFVILAGTTNLYQGATHIYGSFGRSLEKGGYVNGQWVDAWRKVAPDIISAIGGSFPAKGVNLSGHSYGAACALIGAVELIGAYGHEGDIRVMVFGMPRAYTSGIGEVLPSQIDLIESPGDSVTYLPKSLPMLSTKWSPGTPADWIRFTPQWQHYGTHRYLDPTGGGSFYQPYPNPLPPGVASSVIDQHYPDNYAARLNQYRRNFADSPALTLALQAYDATNGVGSSPVFADELPRFVTGPDGEPLFIPGYFGVPENSFPRSGEGVMAYPTALSGGEPWQITFKINQGVQGYSESTHWYLVGVSDAQTKLKNLAALLGAIRRACLTEKAKITTVTIGQAVAGGGSLAYDSASAGCGQGQRPGVPSQESDCIQLKYVDATSKVRTVNYFRGWADADILFDENGNDLNITFSPIANAFANAWKARLLEPYSSFGGTATWCLPTYQRDPALEPTYTVTGFTLDVNGYLVLTFDGTNSEEWKLNDTVHVKPTLTHCTRGLSGDVRVIKADVVGGNTVITVRKKIPCFASQLLGLTGTAQRKTRIYVPGTAVLGGKTGDRQCGGPFGATRGRRRAKSC